MILEGGIKALQSVCLFTLVAVTGCSGEQGNVVARVGDETISVEDVAGYMQRANYGANLADVERAVNEMIDAHLVLARAHSRYVPAPLESLQMVEWRNTLLINQFREDIIWKDVAVDETKLREWYEENVGEQVTADHILIRVPQTATSGEKQAARQEADSLLIAVREGADFAVVARAHSDDTGSAQRDGRMQPFGRGQMVEPFERAAFETPVGEFAPVIESQLGYHILRVVERGKPDLDEVREDIEKQLARPMESEAEDRYVTNIMETSRLEFYETNIDSLIRILNEQRLPEAGERDLKLATFEGGQITLGEIWALYEILPAGNRATIQDLDQTSFVQVLASMVQQKIMLARAEASEIELDSLRQFQLDERVDQLLLSAYLRQASEASLAVDDEELRTYYEEHREFYADRPYEEVAPEIRQVLGAQRLEQASSPDAQRATLAAIADSQESAVDVERNTDTYDQVLRELRRQRAAAGIPEPGQAPAGGAGAQTTAPEPQGAP